MQNKEMRYCELFRAVYKVINSIFDLKEILILITENIVKLMRHIDGSSMVRYKTKTTFYAKRNSHSG